MHELVRRLGLFTPSLRRSIWVHGETRQCFIAALPSIQALMDGRRHVGLVVTSTCRHTDRLLREMFPDDKALPLPAATFAPHWMRRINVQHLVTLDGGHTLSAGWHRAIAQRRLPVTAVDMTSSDAGASQFAALDRVLLRGPSLPPVAQDWRMPTWRDRLGQSRGWQLASLLVDGGRIDSWDELARALNNPRKILCLGNGPSSEDPRVHAVNHDCLVRVNWRWRERGMLTRPQMVFVGDPATISEVNGAIFGLWNCDLEQGMLLRHLWVRGLRTMRYVTMERLCPVIRDGNWPARPSNGALMVAAAAALHPDELTIAGIDLFASLEGRYPGDPVGTNAYSRVHTRDTDIAVIGAALAGFQGKVTIIGDALRDALDGTSGSAR
jgi:hypothetical protein